MIHSCHLFTITYYVIFYSVWYVIASLKLGIQLAPIVTVFIHSAHAPIRHLKYQTDKMSVGRVGDSAALMSVIPPTMTASPMAAPSAPVLPGALTLGK